MPALPDDLARCRALLAGGSRSFFVASLLLPARVRAPATALYAFCRVADDGVDDGRDGAAALADLERRLDRVYAGRPREAPVDRAFAAVVERHALPRALPDALLEGFSWDVAGRRYEAIGDLEAYGLRVAGTVGMMMAVLMGRRSEATLARAADLGIAMQYTNIARDVGDDARAGRVYLPLDWLAEAGVDADRLLASPQGSPALSAVVGRLLDRAEAHYRVATAGIALLPPDCRPAIHAARLVYRAIGRRIADEGVDPVSTRAVVPGRRKLALLAGALGATLLPAGTASAPPPPAAVQLVRQTAGGRRPDDAMGRLVAIFTALDARERAARADRRRLA